MTNPLLDIGALDSSVGENLGKENDELRDMINKMYSALFRHLLSVPFSPQTNLEEIIFGMRYLASSFFGLRKWGKKKKERKKKTQK